MKPLKSQNYYEILSISRSATPEEVRRAYETCLQTFQEDSMAVYSLFNEGERTEIRGMISKAFETLNTFELRREYDRQLLELEGGRPHRPGLTPRTHQAQPQAPVRTLRPTPPPARLSAQPLGGPPEPEPPEPPSAVEEYIKGVQHFTGDVLQKVRIMRGLSVEQIAERTKIRKTYVEYLEREQFQFLPAAVYVKGFVSIIADQLGLPMQKVSQDYMEIFRQAKDV